MVRHIRNGKSLFDNTEIIQDYHVPVFREARLKTKLEAFVNQSQDEISVKPNKENLQLIECLSPTRLKKMIEQ